jgi:uncharacterized protein (DUF58 family)
MTSSADLVRLPNLQLAAQLVADEARLGIHAGRRTGFGTDFAQFRAYQPGDDPRRIDYKRLAQTDRYLVREAETESSHTVRLLLDLSGSMNYTENGVSRLKYSRILLGSLAWLAHRQGDALSLYGLTEGRAEPLVMPGRTAFMQTMATLETARATGSWQPDRGNGSPNRFPALTNKGRELLLLASDLLQVDDEWLNLVRTLANPRREIVIFQVLGRQETEFSLGGRLRLRDLETGQTVDIQGDAARTVIRQNAAFHLERISEGLRLPHIRLVRVWLDDPPALVLSQFLRS